MDNGSRCFSLAAMMRLFIAFSFKRARVSLMEELLACLMAMVGFVGWEKTVPQQPLPIWRRAQEVEDEGMGAGVVLIRRRSERKALRAFRGESFTLSSSSRGKCGESLGVSFGVKSGWGPAIVEK